MLSECPRDCKKILHFLGERIINTAKLIFMLVLNSAESVNFNAVLQFSSNFVNDIYTRLIILVQACKIRNKWHGNGQERDISHLCFNMGLRASKRWMFCKRVVALEQ